MQSLTIRGLVRRRVANSRWLLASVLAGVVAAATLVSAVPVYVSSLTQLSINLEIDNLGRSGSTAFIFTNNLVLTEPRFQEIEQIVGDAVDSHILPAYDGRERILSSHNLWIDASGISEPTSLVPPAAIVRNLTNSDFYIKLESGVHASPTVQDGSDGPIIEAIVSENANKLYGVGVGDEVKVGVSQEAPARVTVRIVGVADNTSLDGTLVSIASGMLNPPTLYDPESGPPPLPLFITEQAVSDAISTTLPGMVMDAIWFIQMEPEALKSWTGGEIIERLDEFERELNAELFGTNLSSPLHRVINGAEARAFFARIPMVLLLAVLAVTVAFYLGMMISYLVQSREEDHALVRTRGFGLTALFRIYSFEGILLTAVAIVVSPILAIALVAAAGVTPHFRGLTDGGLLPIVPQPAPFIVAWIVGLLCLAAVVLPSVLTAQGGVLAQRFRAARPPAASLLHRYHLDVVLLVLGGLIFWELQARGAVVSGGLFGDVDINETLLLAPVLFLVAVALLFMRLFPLFVSYVGGESPALLNVVATVSLAVLLPATIINGVRGIGVDDWPQAAATLAAFGLVYWATTKAVRVPSVILGVLLQVSLVVAFYRISSPDPSSLLFWPFVGLASVVLGQPLYVLLRALARLVPVWVSITLRHVIRRPAQYTWLVVLVVLVTGVSVLATTVGGTLEQSRLDRVRHEVAGDLRVNMSRQFIGGVSTFREMPSVALAAEGIRTDGIFGPLNFEVLGVDSALFHRIAWYRDDFSERPLDQVVADLRPQAGSSLAVLPEGATGVGFWAYPAEHYQGLKMNILLRDASEQLTTVFLGDVGPSEWKLLTAEVPEWLSQPITLVAVHVQDHGDIRQRGITSGTVLVDHLHATVGDEEQVIVEDFESSVFTWLPIIADPLDPDTLEHFTGGAYRGESSAKFTFGQQTDHGVRGFYKAPTRQFLPIVISEQLFAQSGLRLGVPTIIKLAGREIVVIVMDIVKNFPTMSERTDRFVITDVNLLLGHVNVLNSVYAQTANEVYIRAASDDEDEIEELAEELGRTRFIQSSDRVSLLEETNVSPAMSAGWRALAIFALLVAVGAAAAGYVSYLILSDRGRRIEAAFLRSFGFSGKQLIALITFEQLAIIAIALALGTWAGFRMSLLLVSPLAESETGGSIVPPLLTVTDWFLLAPVYAALAAVFLTILVVVSLRVLRVDLGAVARMEA